MRLLVTGGAGYIGSHCVTELLKAGHQVVVIDNLSTGFHESLQILGNRAATFIQEDVRNLEAVKACLREHRVEGVVHFAAKLIVPESVEKPLEYYDNNIIGSLRLLEACHEVGIRHFVFSSTASVYAGNNNQPLHESLPTGPINPYGASKRMIEQIIQDYAASEPKFKFIILRYFNVAGAAMEGDNGQRSPEATHLIKVAAQVVTGQRPLIQIFGTDYATPDGTCIRDYVHVQDLASAHVMAIQALAKGHMGGIFNCGYGSGSSVKEVLAAVNSVVGHPIKTENSRRREGDPQYLVAEPTKIKTEIGWKPKFDSLELICRTAIEWEKRIAKG